MEIPLVEVLTDVECGVSLDRKFLKELSKVLLEDIKSLENLIHNEARIRCNLASPKQLGSVLFDELKLWKNQKKQKQMMLLRRCSFKNGKEHHYI